MGMIGTFDSFTTSRLGIYAAQHGLRVTGNNISNINTEGYTRQRIDQQSFKAGSYDMYRTRYDNHVGNGALVTGINQVRDPYLDIRYRDMASNVGYNETMLGGLEQIASTLDEVGRGLNLDDKGDGILYAQFRDLYKMLQNLNDSPDKANDTLVRNSAETLCSIFHQYANSLETLRGNLDAGFKQDVSSVNEILTNIRELNKSIRESDVHGDNALELRDERNRQIDKLSEYMHIKVQYVMEDIGAGKEVEKLIISLAGDNPNPKNNPSTDETRLIDGVYGAQIELPETLSDGTANDNYTLRVTSLLDSKGRAPKDPDVAKLNIGRPVQLEDNDLYGSFQASRELLTEKGEFATAADVDRDPQATAKRGLPYYQKTMDLLAQRLAEEFNKLNNGTMVDPDGNPVTTEVIGTAAALGLKQDADGYYVDADGNYVGTTAHACLLKTSKISANATQAEKDAFAAAHDSAHKTWAEFIAYHGTKDPNTQVAVTAKQPAPNSGNLFSNRNDNDDPSGITAANISVSHSWSTGAVKVVPTYVQLPGGLANSTKSENVGHMISLIDKSLVYDPKQLDPAAVGDELFQGSFNDMYNNMCSTLGNDQRVINVQYNTGYTSLVEINTSRDGVSGVDLNDEAMNMIQFQKAYSAACRLMTVIDETLDRLINNTGVAGR